MAETFDDDADGKAAAYTKSGYAYVERVSPKSNPDKLILSPMKVHFPSGSVSAILGPSGSGKTTMLNVITDSTQSNVLANADVQLPGLSAFVPQDDRLHGFFTCRSYLMHYARLTGIQDDPKIHEKIDTLLKQLGLFDQADTIVGDLFLKGLSGGQKRRLSVALEALTEPQNLFLDEPTSGLDAESAFQVMNFLKDYARASAGRRVILTIHQPSSFIWGLIDQVILLSKGKLMYDGPRVAMEGFFQSAGYPTPEGWNPADHYVTVVNDEFRNHDLKVDEWADEFQKYVVSDTFMQSVTPRSKSMRMHDTKDAIESSRNPRFSVVFELTYRYFLNLAFNPGILGTRVAMYSMLALMVGALFWDLGERDDFESVQARIAILFYCVAFFIFMSIAVMPFTVLERGIVDKEVLNKYYNPAYYQIAQSVASIPGAGILAGLTTLLVITMTKMNEPGWYFLTMFLSLVVAEAMAQLVSHVVPPFVIGMALMAGLNGFFMLFMGFMLVPSEFPNWLSWVYYTGLHTYAWRTFMNSEFGSNQTFTGSEAFATGYDVLVFYEIEDVNRGNDMVVLLGYFLVVNICAMGALYLRYHLFDGKIEKPTA
uniref:ABC transporter domain-containing protein n=1 Tax=Entomoneis paludosa TaxID=265537 RepID=A0A7S2Y9R9_9STRA|mmetsp:Transcript_2380/g.4963  ORF Transcript_2380/g.4963 Transcript_2380/m.4963 type:complete len:597 (+) Transcript_2380:77-1867(+)